MTPALCARCGRQQQHPDHDHPSMGHGFVPATPAPDALRHICEDCGNDGCECRSCGGHMVAQPAPDAHRHDENDCRDCQHIWRLGYATCAEHPVAPQPDGLDVERLARAVYLCSGSPSCPSHEWHVNHARNIARAYAATPQPAPDALRVAAQAVVEAWDARDYTNRSEHWMTVADTMPDLRAALEGGPA